MDPDACLADLRQLCASLTASADEIAEKFAALDDWITRGGFLPYSWQQGAAHARATYRPDGE